MKLHEHIECEDGFTLSVQASQYHYCYPKKDGLPIYSSYEVSCKPQSILEEYDAGGVYGYVPAQVVLNVIKDHGGFKNGKSKV